MDVHKVETTRRKTEQTEPHYPKRTGRKHANRKHDDDRLPSRDKPCIFCGRKHRRGTSNCAGWGRACRACGKKNHFTSQCKAKEKTHNAEVEEDVSSEAGFLYCVTTKPAMTETVNSVSERELYARMLINEKPVRFHIDCGATVNVFPSKFVNQENIQPSKRVSQMWNKTELKPGRTCRVTIRNPKTREKRERERERERETPNL